MKSTKKKYQIQRSISELLKKEPNLKAIIDKLAARGARALLVGGAVRDMLLGKPYGDIDIEIYHISPEQLEDILSSFGSVIIVGKSFGVFRLIDLDVDFSLPRTDSSGRKPAVTVDSYLSFKDAFRRRDLTMNAMGIDFISGELIDPFNGISDLENKILRTPDATLFVQDPLRFFRVMQFVGRFEYLPDAQLNQVCRSMDLTGISEERIESEIEKLLLYSERPSLGFRWIKEIDRLRDVFPELYTTIGVPQRNDFHPEGDVFEHSMQSLDAAVLWKGSEQQSLTVCYAALCHDLGKVTTTTLIDGVYRSLGHAPAGVKPTKKLLSRITRKHMLIEAVEKLVRYHMEPFVFIKNNAKPAAYKRLALKLAPHATMEQLAALSSADKRGRNGVGHEPLTGEVSVVEQFLEKARASKILHAPEEPLLFGRDVIHLIAPGPKMGLFLKKAYELQIEEGITDKEILLKRLVGNRKLES